MPSLQAKLWNLMFRMIPQKDSDEEHDYIKERKSYAYVSSGLPKNVIFEKMDFDGIYGEKLSARQPSGLIVWYLHGGGLTAGDAVERRSLMVYLAKKYRCTCIATNYRLAPEHPWPAQSDDCMKVYDAIRKRGYDPGKMVIMGDSAGGMLVLSTALRLAAEQEVQPAGLIAFSPTTVMPKLLPARTRNVSSDTMLRDGLNRSEYLKAVFREKAGDMKYLKSPLISPYYGDYSSLPPVFLAASDTVTLYDDAGYLYEKLKREGHKVELIVPKGVFHAYPILYFMPEARETLRRAMDFAMRNTGVAGSETKGM